MRKKKITLKVRGFIFFGKLSQSIVLHFMAHQALHKSFHIFLCSPLLEGESAFPDWESQGQSLTHLPLNLFFTPPLLRSLSYHRVGVLVALPSKLFPRLWLPLLYGFLLGLANGRIIERLKYMGKRQTEHFSHSVSMGACPQKQRYNLHGSSFQEVTPTPGVPQPLHGHFGPPAQ